MKQQYKSTVSTRRLLHCWRRICLQKKSISFLPSPDYKARVFFYFLVHVISFLSVVTNWECVFGSTKYTGNKADNFDKFPAVAWAWANREDRVENSLFWPGRSLSRKLLESTGSKNCESSRSKQNPYTNTFPKKNYRARTIGKWLIRRVESLMCLTLFRTIPAELQTIPEQKQNHLFPGRKVKKYWSFFWGGGGNPFWWILVDPPPGTDLVPCSRYTGIP